MDLLKFEVNTLINLYKNSIQNWLIYIWITDRLMIQETKLCP